MEFIKSGSTMLDCGLNGGWAYGRMGVVAGDPSSGKTQLAISAAAKFHLANPDGEIKYFDTESAFDEEYALKLGLPKKNIWFPSHDTVEAFGDEVIKFSKGLSKKNRALIILDSLDALRTESQKKTPPSQMSGFEMARRAGKIGEVLAGLVGPMEEKNVHFMNICQTRDNVDGYGDAKLISGGNAVKFYSSQTVYLRVVDKLKKTIDKVDHIYGVEIEAFVKKSKTGNPFRKVRYSIIYNRGIDDIGSCLQWLESVNQLTSLPPELLTEGMVSVSADDNDDDEDEDDGQDEVKDDKKKTRKPAKKWKVVMNRLASVDDDVRRKLLVEAVRNNVNRFWNENQIKLEKSVPFIVD